MTLTLTCCDNSQAAQRQEGLSPCATKNGIAVKPVKGDALLFFDMEPNGRDVSRASMHASCPTLKVRCADYRSSGKGQPRPRKAAGASCA